MNARKSLIIWIVYIVWFAGAFYAFARGVQQTEIGPKLYWIIGSLVAFCLGVFIAIRLNRAK